MTSFSSSLRQSLAVGIPQIDDEHQALFDCLDALLLALNTPQGPAKSLDILEQLEAYAATHFASEEGLMVAYGYPQIASHRLAHEAFVRRIQQFREMGARGSIEKPMVSYLIEWLVNHIRVIDIGLAEYAKQTLRRCSHDHHLQ